jgi:hypothetical protein
MSDNTTRPGEGRRDAAGRQTRGPMGGRWYKGFDEVWLSDDVTQLRRRGGWTQLHQTRTDARWHAWANAASSYICTFVFPSLANTIVQLQHVF